MANEQEIKLLRHLFLEQTIIFRNLVQAEDPGARFRMARSLPDNGKNWFIWFNPSSWGHPTSAGVHWALISTQKLKRPSGILHLALGVEDMSDELYAEEFKHHVANAAYEKGVVPENFRLYSEKPRQKKLLESLSIPLDGTTARKACNYYKEVRQFNMEVARIIREFDKAGYFDKTIIYTHDPEE